MADRDLTTQYLKIYPRLKTQTQGFSNAISGEYVYFFLKLRCLDSEILRGQLAQIIISTNVHKSRKVTKNCIFQMFITFFPLEIMSWFFFTGNSRHNICDPLYRNEELVGACQVRQIDVKVHRGWFCTEILILMYSRILRIKLSIFISIHLFWPETNPKYD